MVFVQSRACPAILAVFYGNEGVKLTMSGRKREAWDKGPGESKPGTKFNANWKCWEPIDPARVDDAKAALKKLK